jgi:hypothetical protein
MVVELKCRMKVLGEDTCTSPFMMRENVLKPGQILLAAIHKHMTRWYKLQPYWQKHITFNTSSGSLFLAPSKTQLEMNLTLYGLTKDLSLSI